MLILGIETSCDDTAAAVVADGRTILSNVISSQNEIHEKYGGIVPELASRRHIEMILPVVDEAMRQAGASFRDISALAVSYGPGLIGSLLVGVCFTKALSFVHGIPFVGVNHLEGHIHSIHFEAQPEFPFLSLIVSGGHTSLYRIDGVRQYIELGRTRDDAAGEAYDKVAKLLGLGYPGGPVIDRISRDGNPSAINFPRALLKDSYDFSFSGLKTAVLQHVRRYPETRVEDVAASFQAAVVDILTKRTLEVAQAEKINRIALSGGVSANHSLRVSMKAKAAEKRLEVFFPSVQLCTDNAAMIASAGFYHYRSGNVADLSLNPVAYLHLGPADRQPK